MTPSKAGRPGIASLLGVVRPPRLTASEPLLLTESGGRSRGRGSTGGAEAGGATGERQLGLVVKVSPAAGINQGN